MAELILKNYRSASKKKFSVLLTNIVNGLYNYVLVFVAPPITKTDFVAGNTSYLKANSDYESGGKGFKTAYTTAKTFSFGQLDELYAYCIALPNFNLLMAEQCGFYQNLTKTNGGLLQATFNKMTRMGGNALKIAYNTVAGAQYYVIILVEGGTLPTDFSLVNGLSSMPIAFPYKTYTSFTKPKIKTFTGLLVGTTYNCYAFSGNSHGVSVISAPTEFVFSNK